MDINEQVLKVSGYNDSQIRRIMNVVKEKEIGHDETRMRLLKKSILNMREDRKNSGEQPYKVLFNFAVPGHSGSGLLDTPAMMKVQEIFQKYGKKIYTCDTMAGDYNLNRDWAEVQGDVDCFVEFCGVYPVDWDIDDVVTIDEMEHNGEIMIHVDWHVGDKYVPNH